MIKQIACKIVGHNFSDWEYIDTTTCTQTRVCRRDGYSEIRQVHDFSTWDYTSDGSCEQVCTCKRDGYQETRQVRHEFSDWTYISPESCVQKEICYRCGKAQPYQQVDHTFSDWEKSEDDPYHETRKCKRCKTKEKRTSKPKLAEKKLITTPKTEYGVLKVDSSKCDQCDYGAWEVGTVDDPTPYNRYDSHAGYADMTYYRYCKICGHRDE